MGMKHWIAMGMVLGCSTAVLASTTDVIVTGTITPGGCTTSLSGGGTFDFGIIRAAELNQSGKKKFVSPAQQLAVNCDAPTRFMVRGVDARADSADFVPGSVVAFGLGKNDIDEKIGFYFLQTVADSYVADGVTTVNRLITTDSGTNWAPDTDPDFSNFYNGAAGHYHGFAASGTAPTPITDLTANLQIDMRVNGRDELTVNKDVPIDGASTIELTYL
ncbi:DUF1120 domain-containing protein [Pseudomonas sp. NPDC089406]|uniref:DUF1120 domain-containing protein n=1 Tax=Pseudomonas sp. NPDC089406 TaxID=3364463 RepID=UPI00384B6D4E